MERVEERVGERRRRGPLGAVALIAGCALVLGVVAGGGCWQAQPLESGGPSETQGDDAKEIGAARSGLVTAPVCVDIRRQGAAGSVLDTQVLNKLPPKTFGNTTVMNVTGAAGSQRESLIQFDLGAIPSGPNVNITTATVTLTVGPIPPTGPDTISVHRITAPWSEATVDWLSFNQAFSPTVETTFSNAGSTYSFSIQALAQQWVQGTAPNYGILLDGATSQITQFNTSETSTLLQRPGLHICYTITCNPGFADCNNNASDGCETDVATTPANCGGCGVACSVPHATPACVGGACQVGACSLGFGDCDHVAANGCETLLTTNTDCGGCGVACALPNATSSCATGTCALVACNAGSFDCDGNPQNGCEATPCVNGSHCANAAGCQSGVCTGGFCASPSCTDGVKNGAETSVDCGGGACPPCANGQGCALGSDCASGVCTAGVCQGSACNDGIKNGNETSVDCGGGTCPACAAGKSCLVGSDCVDLVCQGGVCQLASCSDGVKNGSETDIDCGGPCAPCNNQLHCTVNSDCASQVCTSGVCQVPTCSDGVKNGNETGVDCGGACFVAEVCDGIDNDCNGLVDDGLGTTTCGIGACQVTVQNCVGGVPQTCVPFAPQPEQCDGLIDDDCDGVVDNNCVCIDGTTQGCYTGAPVTLGVGACHAGTQTCVHGQWGACVGEVTPAVESCDGIDNDCNGQVDDALGVTVCGVGGCQVTVQNCVNGLPQTCTPNPPSVETCDNVDNDCNGIVDDNLPVLNCGVGACQNSVPSCVGGTPQTCVPKPPSAELCDGIDNDCDGVIDNGNPGGNQACSTGKLGVCAAGLTACTSGSIVCNQTTQPSAEVCDGLDNDCDGQVDQGNPGGNAACNTGKLGVCAAGLTVCSSGQLACQQSQQPSAEACDGVDNDCDGVIDNGNPGGNQACNTGKLGVCAAGTTACTGGQVVCNQNVQPSAEVCDGVLDESCNGQIDEGCNCTNGATRPCYSGAAGTNGVGVCHGGTQTCAGGNWGACVGEVLPSTEVCDGLDNNCNGQVDDGLGTISCGVGACQRTVPACASGHANTCTPGTPTAEVCDGIDNNCDGNIDEGNPGGNAGCNTGQLGACAAGTTSCVLGALVCNRNQGPTAEVCDGVDNNCNGSVDEGNPGGGVACNTGQLGVCAAGTKACTGGVLVCNRNQGPSAETCNNVDDNCNGQVDENVAIGCYDGPPGTNGVGACHGGVAACSNGSFGPCNGQVLPSVEVCNAVDDNCNGQVDENVATGCYDGPPGTNGVGICHGGLKFCSNGSFGACSGQVLPGTESCNGVDDNCNGQIDENITISCYTGPAGTNGVGACHSGTQTCSFGSFGPCNGQVTPISEFCNGVDDNCNGAVDDGVMLTWYRDADGDGYGDPNPNITTLACSQPPGYTNNNIDCNDSTAGAHPGLGEACGDGIDNNCDGSVDENCPNNNRCEPNVGENCGNTSDCACDASSICWNNSCCGPYPHYWIASDGVCRPSCGVLLGSFGLPDDGQGCNVFRGTVSFVGQAYDCNICSSAP